MGKSALFKNFVLRVGGYNFDFIENQSCKDLKSKLTELLTIYYDFQRNRKELNELLFQNINKETDRTRRNKLLDLKRQINSIDLINKSQFTLLKNDSHSESINKLNDLIIQYKNLKDVINTKYYECEKKNRGQLKELLKNNYDLQNGILLSSKSLYQSMNLYYSSSKTVLDKREEQIENGILRYFTRMSTKSTPFSTLCSIIPGSFYDESFTNGITQIFSNEPLTKRSELTLNKEIYGNIIEFIYKDKDIRRFLPIEINPTISSVENNYRFLTSIENKELFQRLQMNPVLELIYNKLSKEELNRIEFQQILNLIVQLEEIDATHEEAEAYLDKLLEIGFIRFTIGIPNQDAYWHKPLKKILSKIENHKAHQLFILLNDLENHLDIYINVDVGKRNELLIEILKRIDTCFKELGIKELKRPNLPIYEDATANSSARLSSQSIQNIENILREYILITRKVAYPRSEHANMRHFFDTYYKDEKQVPLLMFYEDYYREHFKEHLQKVQKIQAGVKDDELKKYNLNNPFNLDFVKELTNFNADFNKLIIKKWNANPDVQEINLTLAELDNLTADINDYAVNSFCGSLFAQPIFSPIDNSIQVVIPGGKYLLAFGKYFSRFLYLFDKEYSKSVLTNNNLMTDDILAEICHDANFNANLHPQLVDYEIVYPTSESGYSKNKISCTEILVVPNDFDQNSLDLIHSTSGKKIIPLDLGFLNPMMRPPLFQLLSKFTPPSNYSLQIPEISKEFNSNKEAKKSEDAQNPLQSNSEQNVKKKEKIGIIYRPRIILENSIIISRRSWRIPTSEYPQIRKEENKHDYFIRINKWRIENNIPDQVYIRVRPLPIPVKPRDTNKQQARDDERKSDSVIDEKNNGIDQELKSGHEEVDSNQNIKTDLEQNIQPDQEKNNKIGETDKDKTKKDVQKYSKDFYKPQYIDFNNPLLLNLFMKITGNLQNYVVTIEERLPGFDQLAKYEEKHFATELILQFDIMHEIKSNEIEPIPEVEINEYK